MLNSQPLNSEISKKLESYEPKKDSLPVKQYMGRMFDGLLDSKISFKTRLSWLGRRISDAWYDFHYTVKNWAKWRKTISSLRPWEGFAGVLTLVQKHLKDYEVHAKYPEYKELITEYSDGCTSYSGDFVALGNGWAGIEAGADPRRGYFELVNGKFELTAISDESVQNEVEQILAQIENYHADFRKALTNAEKNMEDDKKRLGELLSEHFFTWWD